MRILPFGLVVAIAGCQWVADIDDKVQGSGGAQSSSSGHAPADAGSDADAGPPCLLQCDGICVDSLTDPDHCGSCNVLCPSGVQCDGGICGRSLFRAAGSDTVCAVKPQGNLYCWGANADYQAGLKTSVGPGDIPFASKITGPNVRYVASSGDATCALLTSGSVACFGANPAGELGNGMLGGTVACMPFSGSACVELPVTTIATGVDEISGAGALGIFGGYPHFCARTKSGTVSCWGQFSADSIVTVPTDQGIHSALQITSGVGFDCALLEDASVWCWGSNSKGELGQGDLGAHEGPVQVHGLGSVRAIGAGVSHVCAIGETTIYCWGSNNTGQLGIGVFGDAVPTPTPIAPTPGLGDAVQIGGAVAATCALTSGGNVFCWGRSDFGLLGNGTIAGMSCGSGYPCVPTPTQTNVTAAVEIALSGTAALARMANGALVAWGNNVVGQLGDGRPELASASPVKVKEFP